MMTPLPEKLAPGIYRVDALPIKEKISVLLVAEPDGWTLIDTGVASGVPRIQAALVALGGDATTLRRIYLTHHHSDHVGGLAALAEWAPGAEIVAPEREAPIIAGQQPPDPSSNPLFEALTRTQRLPTYPVARTVREGDTLGGFRVVATPGHTLGHTSLFHADHRLLMTADAFGQLARTIRVGVTKPFCTDPALARHSAGELLDYDFTVAVMSHGPVLHERAKDRLRAAIERSGR